MKKSSKIEWLIVSLVLASPACGWWLSETRWSRINYPDGKFTNVSEYLANGRQPGRVTKVKKDGDTFFIAHCPMDTWLALPSGPAAYVFDKTGRMIEWSSDTGEDPEFQRKWLLSQEHASIEELKQIESRPIAFPTPVKSTLTREPSCGQVHSPADEAMPAKDTE